jgi:hypothetical protein
LQQQTHVIPIVFIGAVDVEETGSIVKKNGRFGRRQMAAVAQGGRAPARQGWAHPKLHPRIDPSAFQAIEQWAARVLRVKVILMAYRDAVDIAPTIDAFAA